MENDELICGYTVGRYVPSKGAFLARASCGADEPLRLLEMERPDEVWGCSGVGSGVGSDVDAGLVDVGRLIDGSLVLIRDAQLAPGPTARLDEIQTQLFERPPVSVVPAHSAAPADSAVPDGTGDALDLHTFVSCVRSAVGKRLQLLLSVLQQRVRGRGRLIIVFISVGVVLTIVLAVLLSGNETTVEPTGSSAAASSSNDENAGDQMTSVAPDSATDADADAVSFALSEVREGRGVIVSGDSSEGTELSDITARVVSRNGDIALVEVSSTQGGKKTFATLLLQMTESGWRTRDTFDSEG